MPNKTIYVADADLPLFQRAQELVGGNLSQAIVKGLRRLVEVEEGKLEGFDEVTVKVGTGKGRRQRFLGILLVEWGRTRKGGVVDEFRVYRTRTGKIALYHKKSEEFFHQGGPDGQATGWRKHFSQDQLWGTTPATATLEVYETVAELEGKIPAELYDLVAAAAEEPLVEDLDI